MEPVRVCANATLKALLDLHTNNDHSAGLFIAYYNLVDGFIRGGAGWVDWNTVLFPVGVCLSGQVDGLDDTYVTACRFAHADNDHESSSAHEQECIVNRPQLRVTDACYAPIHRRPWFRLDDYMFRQLLGLVRYLFQPSHSESVAVDADMRFKSVLPVSPPTFPPIYAPYGFSNTVHDLINVIKGSVTSTTFDLDLECAFVTNVSHWRSPTSEHELVTVTYKAGNTGEHTTRHLGLERFKLQTDRTGSALPDSLQVAFQPVSTWLQTDKTQSQVLRVAQLVRRVR